MPHGCQLGLPLVLVLAPTSPPCRTCTGNNVAAQRNYPCDNYLVVYFGDNEAFLNSTGEAVFKEQLYKVW